MRRLADTVHYNLLTYRLDQLYLPTGFWVLFFLICWIERDSGHVLEPVRGFLGFCLPLVGGILAAYAVLDDPALELYFATPRPAWRPLVERLGLILVILTMAALAFQGGIAALGIDTTALGGLAARQLGWLVPSLAMIALGILGGLALAQATGGALLAGMMWTIQLLGRGWFIRHPIARYVFIFSGMGPTPQEVLRVNQLCLLALAALMLFGAWALLKRQERYI